MKDNVTEQVGKITKKEYLALKKSREKMITAGVFFLIFGFIFAFVISSGHTSAYFLGAECILGGVILLINSFANEKYAVLKYVRFEAGSKELSVSQTAAAQPVSETLSPDGEQDAADRIETQGRTTQNDRIIGCLLGGAAGDALGYAVEFVSYDGIIKKYGKKGITSYSLDRESGKALISDDTQMTLFTAQGLLEKEGAELQNIYKSYKNWLITQTVGFGDRPANGPDLMEQKELYSQRLPGNTCLSALTYNVMGTVAEPINSSKGCGGVMRVSPVAFLDNFEPMELDKLAAQSAAITHGHPLGFLPAALLVHIIHKTIFENGSDRSLGDIINESIAEFSSMFSSTPYFDDLITLVRKAIDLSGNGQKDTDNIKELGEGWVAEETLAIAIYSALRYQNDFSAALVASVNHDGDSDSTGALTGNILGAYLGEAGIDAKWKEHLELYDLILKTAEKFCN